MKKRCKKALPYIVIIVLLLIFNVPFPVHREIFGVLIQPDNPDFCEKITIELDGWYHLNWLTHDKYRGFFRISNDDLTKRNELLFPIAAGADFDEAESDLQYDLEAEKLSKEELTKVQDGLKWYNGGRVLSKRFFRKICIVVASAEKKDDGSVVWDYGDLSNGKCSIIVAGADTFEDAVNILTISYGDAIELP